MGVDAVNENKLKPDKPVKKFTGLSLVSSVMEYCFYGVCIYAIIWIIQIVVDLAKSIGYYFPISIGLLVFAYCFRKFLIFLILRKK